MRQSGFESVPFLVKTFFALHSSTIEETQTTGELVVRIDGRRASGRVFDGKLLHHNRFIQDIYLVCD